MLVALLTHPGDRYLAVPLCERIRDIGNVSKHECLIVAPFGTDMTGIEDVLRQCFMTVTTHRYQDTMKGWPYGANEAAEQAMMHIFTNPALRYHYLMLEPDCVPNHPMWLDHLDMEYRRCGMPVLGVRIPTIRMSDNAQVGRHTVGVAIYPKNFPQICPLVRSLSTTTRAYAQQHVLAPPWDAYFGPYTQKMTFDTDLIQHLARTQSTTPNGLRWDCPSLENALSQVRPEAMLIHGSKDPEFLRSISTHSNATQTRKIESDHSPEHFRDAPREVVREGAAPAREENGGQNGSGGSVFSEPPTITAPALSPKKLAQAEKVRQRQLAEAEAIRKEYEIEAALGTPEWSRSSYFLFGMSWNKVRAYAGTLRLRIHGMKKGQLINSIVAEEKKQMKEPWTKVFEKPAPVPPIVPVEESPEIPVGTSPVSTSVKTTVAWIPADDSGKPINPPAELQGGISPSMQEKMKQLMRERGMVGV